MTTRVKPRPPRPTPEGPRSPALPEKENPDECGQHDDTINRVDTAVPSPDSSTKPTAVHDSSPPGAAAAASDQAMSTTTTAAQASSSTQTSSTPTDRKNTTSPEDEVGADPRTPDAAGAAESSPSAAPTSTSMSWFDALAEAASLLPDPESEHGKAPAIPSTLLKNNQPQKEPALPKSKPLEPNSLGRAKAAWSGSSRDDDKPSSAPATITTEYIPAPAARLAQDPTPSSTLPDSATLTNGSTAWGPSPPSTATVGDTSPPEKKVAFTVAIEAANSTTTGAKTTPVPGPPAPVEADSRSAAEPPSATHGDNPMHAVAPLSPDAKVSSPVSSTATVEDRSAQPKSHEDTCQGTLASPKPDASPGSETPTPQDYISGPGRKTYPRHPGNIRYNSMVAACVDEYSGGGVEQKKDIIHLIAASFRFFRQERAGVWRILTEPEVHDKVRRALMVRLLAERGGGSPLASLETRAGPISPPDTSSRGPPGPPKSISDSSTLNQRRQTKSPPPPLTLAAASLPSSSCRPLVADRQEERLPEKSAPAAASMEGKAAMGKAGTGKSPNPSTPVAQLKTDPDSGSQTKEKEPLLGKSKPTRDDYMLGPGKKRYPKNPGNVRYAKLVRKSQREYEKGDDAVREALVNSIVESVECWECGWDYKWKRCPVDAVRKRLHDRLQREMRRGKREFSNLSDLPGNHLDQLRNELATYSSSMGEESEASDEDFDPRPGGPPRFSKGSEGSTSFDSPEVSCASLKKHPPGDSKGTNMNVSKEEVKKEEKQASHPPASPDDAIETRPPSNDYWVGPGKIRYPRNPGNKRYSTLLKNAAAEFPKSSSTERLAIVNSIIDQIECWEKGWDGKWKKADRRDVRRRIFERLQRVSREGGAPASEDDGASESSKSDQEPEPASKKRSRSRFIRDLSSLSVETASVEVDEPLDGADSKPAVVDKKGSSKATPLRPTNSNEVDDDKDVESVLDSTTDSVETPWALPLPPEQSNVNWSLDEVSRIVRVDFSQVSSISSVDKKFLATLMERDDVVVISKGIFNKLDGKRWTLSALVKSFGERPIHNIRRFEYDKTKSHTVYRQHPGYTSVRGDDFVRYLKRKISSLDDNSNYVDESRRLRFRDAKGFRHEIDIDTTVLDMTQVDMRKQLPVLVDDFQRKLKVQEMMTGGEWCMLRAVGQDQRSPMGPYLQFTPGGSITHFVEKVVDTEYFCLGGFDEFVILRRLPEEHKRIAMLPLVERRTGVEQSHQSDPSHWPQMGTVKEWKAKNYCPAVFTLEPGDHVHIGKGRLHAVRKISSASLPPDDCHAATREEILLKLAGGDVDQCLMGISVTYEWLYGGASPESIQREVSAMLESADLYRREKRKLPAIPETCVWQTAANLHLNKSEQETISLLAPPLFASEGQRTDSFIPDDLDVCRGILQSLRKLVEVEARAAAFVEEKRLNVAEEPDIYETDKGSFKIGYDNYICAICLGEISNGYFQCPECIAQISTERKICTKCILAGTCDAATHVGSNPNNGKHILQLRHKLMNTDQTQRLLEYCEDATQRPGQHSPARASGTPASNNSSNKRRRVRKGW